MKLLHQELNRARYQHHHPVGYGAAVGCKAQSGTISSLCQRKSHVLIGERKSCKRFVIPRRECTSAMDFRMTTLKSGTKLHKENRSNICLTVMKDINSNRSLFVEELLNNTQMSKMKQMNAVQEQLTFGYNSPKNSFLSQTDVCRASVGQKLGCKQRWWEKRRQRIHWEHQVEDSCADLTVDVHLEEQGPGFCTTPQYWAISCHAKVRETPWV